MIYDNLKNIKRLSLHNGPWGKSVVFFTILNERNWLLSDTENFPIYVKIAFLSTVCYNPQYLLSYRLLK